MLNSLKSIWTKNWSAAWGWSKVAAGSAVAVIPTVSHSLGSVLNDARVSSSIDQLHLDPKVGLGLAVLGVITLISVEHA